MISAALMSELHNAPLGCGEGCCSINYYFVSSSGPSGSRGALGALMTCLRAAKAQGVVPSSKEGLWGGLVPLSLLQRALVHKHDQVSV